MQTEGYQVYEEFGKQEGIVLIQCMAHARRKFGEALPNDKQRGEHVLSEIQKLYAIERQIQEAAFSDDQSKLTVSQKPCTIVYKDGTGSAFMQITQYYI